MRQGKLFVIIPQRMTPKREAETIVEEVSAALQKLNDDVDAGIISSDELGEESALLYEIGKMVETLLDRAERGG